MLTGACARKAALVGEATTHAATMRGRIVNVPEGKREVLVDARIADRCPAIRRAPDDAPPAALLGALARCLLGNELRDERIVVSGGMRERIFIRHALADLGVDTDRIETSGPLDDDDCLEGCDDDKERVKIELSARP